MSTGPRAHPLLATLRAFGVSPAEAFLFLQLSAVTIALVLAVLAWAEVPLPPEGAKVVHTALLASVAVAVLGTMRWPARRRRKPPRGRHAAEEAGGRASTTRRQGFGGRGAEPGRMSNPNNPGHGKPQRAGEDVDPRDLEARNEAAGAGLPDEEEHDVHKAGGGTVGGSLGGANDGRYGASPANVVSNRDRKPRGRDKEQGD